MSTETRASTKWVSVTPSDTADIPHGTVKAIYVGGAGNLVAVGRDGQSATFTGVAAGTVLPINPKRINSTSTTATAILALYD